MFSDYYNFKDPYLILISRTFLILVLNRSGLFSIGVREPYKSFALVPYLVTFALAFRRGEGFGSSTFPVIMFRNRVLLSLVMGDLSRTPSQWILYDVYS